MKNTVLVTLILGLMASGGWWEYHRAQRPRLANVAEYESDMTEGLLRGIFQELDEGEPLVYYVAFGQTRTSPSYGFIARFADHVPAVQGFALSVSPPTGVVLEASSGRTGVIIQIISFKACAPGGFDVLVAFSNLPSGHDRFIYRVFNNGGDWRIQSRKLA